jgi:ribosomal protein S19E (S16A)
VGEHYMTLGKAEEYLLEHYGITWSRPTWRKYIRTGALRGRQLGERGWWYVTRESIDDFLKPQA